MEITGGIDPKCTLHIPSDFSPVKTIAVAALSNDLSKHQISADSKEAVHIAQREQMLQLDDSSEQESGDMVTARKSLAWDSAFFDSAGILDEEELSNMMDGACTSKKNTYNTISTLERIEAELFTDIRASTQKFVKEEPNLGNLNGKAAVEDKGTKVTNSSKKTITTPSRNRSSPIVKKEPVSSEGSQQIKRQGSRHVPAVQAVTSIHKAPITTGRSNSISTQSRTVSNASLSKLDPKKSKDTGKRDYSSVKALMGGVSTKPVLISRSVSLSSSSSSSHLINRTSSSIDLGRKAGSTTAAVHQKRLPSNTTTKSQTDLKSYLMLSNKLSSRKSSASSVSDTSSESCLSTLALNNRYNRRSNESSSSCKSVVQSRVGRTLDFMSKSNDRLLGTVRSLSKAMANQELKKGGPINGAKPVKPSSKSVGARISSSLNKGSLPQIGKGKVGTGAIKGSDSRWMM